MAEFEELRLTVNLVDNASTGLTKIRGEIGQLTGTATTLTSAVNAASAGVTNLGGATNKTAPGVRTLNQQMREASRSANEFKDSFVRLGAAAQGLSSMPQLAAGVRDMGFAVHGLGQAFAAVGTTAKFAAIGVGSVVLGIAALGASVVAYGISVFRFAREMEQLSKTAKQMGLSFAELKYAQDQAKLFGQSAESIVRSFQGVQDAQFDLWKNNSQLRQKLIGMGVDANWVNQLAAMDPNKARNAITGYGRALERQLLDAGVAKGVARALRNQFGSEFGFSAEDMDMPELPDPDPKTAAELKRIEELSKDIAKVWAEITHIWDEFSTEILAMGLPILRDALQQLQAQLPAMLDTLKTEFKGLIDSLPGLIESIPGTLTNIRTTMGEVAGLFRDVAGLFSTINTESAALKPGGEQDRQSLQDGGGAAPPSASSSASRAPAAPSMSGPRATGPSTMPQLARPGIHLQSFGGAGANDNNPLLVQASLTSNELIDETDRNTTQTEKLTAQLEKLVSFFERMEERNSGGGRVGGGGGGFQNASFTTGGGTGTGGSGGGGGGGAGSGGFKSGGGYTVLDQQRAGGDGADNGTASGGSPPSSGTGAGAQPASTGSSASDGASPSGAAKSVMSSGNVAALGTVPQSMGGSSFAASMQSRAGGGAIAAPSGEGESWSPEGGEVSAPSAIPTGIDLSKLNQPFGELKSATRSPTTQASDLIQQGLMAGGADAYKAGHIAKGIVGIVQASPFGVPGAAADLLYHKGEGDTEAAALDAFSMLPGAKHATKFATAMTGVSQAFGGSIWGTGKDIASSLTPDRASLTASQDDATKVRADGNVTVKVGNNNAAQSNAANDSLFAATPLQSQAAGQLTQHGANVADVANDYMARKVASR